MLTLNEVNVYIGDLHILKDVSLFVKEREIVALLGPNGAGKTTLAYTIMGIYKPKRGYIKFMNKIIDGLPTYQIIREGICLVPEGRRLFTTMTVKENLELGAFAPHLRSKKDETLEWIYSIFPVLKDRSDQLAGTLSGGEAQMLTIARALMAKPRILIMDEPSTGLAPKLISLLFNIIKSLVEKEGLSVLLIEQRVRETLQIADRAYVLENGKVVLEGPSKSLIDEEKIRSAYLGI